MALVTVVVQADTLPALFSSPNFSTLAFLSPPPPVSTALPAEVSQALSRAAIPVSSTGIYVQEADSKRVVLSVNSDLPFNPASTMKLVTSYAALELLGPTFTWKTQAYLDGVQNGDVLQGNLIIKGGGDPKLVLENFWRFLRQIRMRGIREIHGDVLLDRRIFEEQAYDAAQFDGDPAKPYNVGPDALLLNYKTLALRFMSDKATVRVLTDPVLPRSAIAPPRLTQTECGDWQSKLQPEFDGAYIKFAGVFSTACGEKTWYLHPFQMSNNQYFGWVFRQLWAELGGSFTGDVKNGEVTPSARFIAEWESPSLAEVLRDINKYSNNVMARQLLLTLAMAASTQAANTLQGAAVVKNWLARKVNKKVEDLPTLSIENGAGLSRSERISAELMGNMLAAAFQSPVMPELIASLPLVGYDGTMRKRLKNNPIAGRAHIKTGSLDEVRTLAGYVLAASGKRYVVVFFINHHNAAAGQEAQDAFLEWIYRQG